MFCYISLAFILLVFYGFHVINEFNERMPMLSNAEDQDVWVDVTVVEPCIVPSSIQCWEYRTTGVY